MKEAFLRSEYIQALNELEIDTPPKWGKMNVQQMIEHMSDYVRIASGRTPVHVVTPDDRLEKMLQFLESEKPFRENTPNQLMPDTPPAPKHQTKAGAVAELQSELDHFFDVFQSDKEQTVANPFFGHLNYNRQVQLLHKHATHHLRQFGLDF